MKVGSLFSGIGGLDLGLERAGHEIVFQCELEPYRRAVLGKHWPGIPCYEDIRAIDGRDWADVECLAGGFPCEDLSNVGKRAGIEGLKSGLWSEYARLVDEIRPRYVFVENVPSLLVRGMGRVLGDLAAIGYDAEWDCIPAAAIGALHLRARMWLLAYPAVNGDGVQAEEVFAGGNSPKRSDWWDAEPGVGRVADGVPHRVDRLGSLGDAVVPQIAEWIGRRLG